jgi:7,8-dihydropterin-6-yl-methyl-4-(beta-D-ribofuranosyl)aminobenzene 5'-phosphate synthase
MTLPLKEIERVEITTLQDNYVDVLAADGNEVVHRPLLVNPKDRDDWVLSASPLAEHGFSAFIRVADNTGTECMLFDFGGSPDGAARNAGLLGVKLKEVSSLALSHGHMDHFRGMKALVEKIGKDSLCLTVHPAAFRPDRYMKTPMGKKIFFPALRREEILSIGLQLRETARPHPLLDGRALFLGEIPRRHPFEQGMKNAFFEENGKEKPDPIEDDTALVFNVRGKGLVVLSGCAHSGILNTVDHAREVTGVDRVFAVMGGFHLTGPAFSAAVAPTIQGLKAMAPDYVVPAHCTGREATLAIEQEMPDKFLLNMSGTRMVFSEKLPL